MTEDKARELVKRFGVRMCDENGDTHNEELYCIGLDDIMEMAQALDQQKRAWVKLIRGVRVENDTVIVTARGGNDSARELCAALLKEMNP